jgi:NAD(P)-dependent dehydrogenase (short-subunit alcohol dehydrogenase family)
MFQHDLLKGESILITGGGTGLGRAMGERLLALGADLHICGRRQPVLEEAAAEMTAAHGGKVTPIACDLRDSAAVDAMVEEIFRQAPLTALVNNAAGNFISRTQDLSARGFDAVANTVFHGTFYATHSVGKRWIERQLKGSVLSIVVTWVTTGSPFVVPSAMSKAGIDVMTKSLAVEWGRYGIRLNAIAPGIFPTEGATARLRPEQDAHKLETESNPMRRLGRMDELANLAAFLLAPGCEWLTGQTIAIDGGNALANGAYFTQYMDWPAERWAAERDRIKSVNERDKALRTTPAGQ